VMEESIKLFKIRPRPLRPRKALRVCFLRNGDPYFQGVILPVSHSRYKDFQTLLEAVTEALGKHVVLRSAVTHIRRIDGSPFTTMGCFFEGDVVVCCCKYEKFVPMTYQVSKDCLRLFHSQTRWEDRRTGGKSLEDVKASELPNSIHTYLSDVYALVQKPTSVIFKGTGRADNSTEYVVKMVDKRLISSVLDDPYVEMEVLRQLQSHENIVDLVHTVVETRHIFMVMESLTCDLDQLIRGYGPAPQPKARAVLKAAQRALVHMQRHQIIHRDIKPENILVRLCNTDDDDHDDWPQLEAIKITDFGLAVHYRGSKLYSCYGTPHYMAPEVVEEAGYDYQADAWSLGISLFHLLAGYRPFGQHNENLAEIYAEIVSTTQRYPKDWKQRMGVKAKNLIDGLLKKRPIDRTTIAEVAKHPFLF
ncbi:hypothetical protein KR009_009701, partial [Drosophila setifemur]